MLKMSAPSVLTGPTSPVSVPNPVAGVLTGKMAGIPNPDTALETFINATLISALLASFLGQKYTPKTKESFKHEYDYVIVGGGAAGCVLASRLSEKECACVLLLEAGKSPDVLSEVPGVAWGTLVSDAAWSFRSEPQEYTAKQLSDERVPYSGGKGVGGSSLINAMLYSRGNPRDYDDWERMGADGWSYKDVFRYFLKMENNTDADMLRNGRCHRAGGPMTFSRVRYTPKLKGPVLAGAKSLGYEVRDINCGNQLGMADLQTFIRDGQRCSTAKAYLVPVDDRPNLDIVTEAYVTKIRIRGKTACGVNFKHKGRNSYVRARREVILSAGAINSPKILMLSGIGPRKTLEKFNIPVHADLPVGKNFQDHPTSILFFTVDPPAERYGLKVIDPKYIHEYITNRSGPLASPTAVFNVGFHRSPDAETPRCVPNYESYFIEGENLAARFTFGIKPLTYEKFFFPYESSAVMWCYSSIVNPQSRGYVTLRSRDPLDDPIIQPMFLKEPQDVKDMVAGLEWCLKVAETPAVRNAGVKPFETKMPGCEHVADDRDKYLECYVRAFISSICHQSCTVKMGDKKDPTTVLDPHLRVKGINHLRVVDASVMPKVPSGNTMIPVVMIAEKASDMIKKTIRCP